MAQADVVSALRIEDSLLAYASRLLRRTPSVAVAGFLRLAEPGDLGVALPFSAAAPFSVAGVLPSASAHSGSQLYAGDRDAGISASRTQQQTLPTVAAPACTS